jgi:lysophospholipase L1-like esterase
MFIYNHACCQAKNGSEVSTARDLSDMQALPLADRPDTIYFLGDSITLGWRDEDLGGWPARLMRRLANAGHDITGYNLGIRGDTSREIGARWKDEVGRRRRGARALLVFAFGVNDAKIEPDGRRSMPIEETAANMRGILRDAARHSVLVIGPAPIDEALMHRRLNAAGDAPMPTEAGVAEVAALLAREADAAGVPFLDLLSTLASDPAWRRSLAETDGLHPSGAGHDILADQIRRWPAWSSLFSNEDRGRHVGS